MVDAEAVRKKAKNMPKRSKAQAMTPSHKHCRICGIDIPGKSKERVCKVQECIDKLEKDEKNQKQMRILMFVFFGLFAIPMLGSVVLRLLGY
jgi:predicted nucleic acid-binding Zn ribbon protein